MRRRRPRTVLIAIAIAAATYGGAAHAQSTVTPAPLPIGTDGHGVRIVRHGHPARLVLLLSAKRYRAAAGHQVELECSDVPRVTLGGGSTTRDAHGVGAAPHPRGSRSAFIHAPRRRGPIATQLAPRWDYCVVNVNRRDGPNGTATVSLATVPLTPAGAAFADERRAAFNIVLSMDLLELGGPHRPTVQRLVRRAHGVVLSSPAEVPPPGTLGLYSDGAAHLYAAESDHAGKLLFLEKDGDVTRTNLLRYLESFSLLWGARS